MGTISDKLMRIINTKEDIRQALISKGYDVPTSIPFKEYAKMILDLPCKADSFPDIEGIVARYSALGLTNEQMAENPVWVDKTGNGHDLQLKNLAWGGMSGVGGYEMNFNLWRNNVSGIPDISMSTTTTSVSVSVGNSTYNNNLIYIHISNWDINKNHWLKVTSTYEDGDLAFIFYNNSNTKKIGLPANGYVNILAYPEFKGNYMYISTTFNKQGSFTIEQLPLYPGALVFDGVDDYGVCENFPILTKEKGYTVVALRQWIEEKNDSTALVSNCKNWGQDGAFLFEYNNLRINFLNVAISFGHVSSVDRGKSPFSYQTSKLYNGKNIEPGSFIGSNELVVGKGNKDFPTVSKVAIWELIILDHDATEEELTKIKDYFVKTYPWLFPYQAWTVVGKTNEDEDRATIANITGNGNNLVLSNFGFAEGSGYGLYAQNYISYAITNRAVYTKTNSSIHVTKSITAGVNFTESARDVTIPSYRIKVTGIQSGQEMIYRGSNNTFLTNIPSDGIYVLPAVENGSNLGFQFVSYTGDCDITIEQIPEYEGYLVTDGVDDRVQDSSFKLNKDWTLVGEWVFLNQKATNAGITKPFSFVVYNRTTGLSLFINTGTSGITIENVKSIKAICSDGRIYFDDWSKMLISKDQDITSSTSVLSIGFNGTAYTQMAFKNLGIYNNQLLSKDDCIKAYNYLQTLKSK